MGNLIRHCNIKKEDIMKREPRIIDTAALEKIREAECRKEEKLFEDAELKGVRLQENHGIFEFSLPPVTFYRREKTYWNHLNGMIDAVTKNFIRQNCVPSFQYCIICYFLVYSPIAFEYYPIQVKNTDIRLLNSVYNHFFMLSSYSSRQTFGEFFLTDYGDKDMIRILFMDVSRFPEWWREWHAQWEEKRNPLLSVPEIMKRRQTNGSDNAE